MTSVAAQWLYIFLVTLWDTPSQQTWSATSLYREVSTRSIGQFLDSYYRKLKGAPCVTERLGTDWSRCRSINDHNQVRAPSQKKKTWVREREVTAYSKRQAAELKGGNPHGKSTCRPWKNCRDLDIFPFLKWGETLQYSTYWRQSRERGIPLFILLESRKPNV